MINIIVLANYEMKELMVWQWLNIDDGLGRAAYRGMAGNLIDS